MRSSYNRIAGGSVERIAALSDGLFAIAMTLLVLELHTPISEAIRTEADLLAALCALAPHIVTWLMSFLTLGIFWIGQQTQLSQLERSNRDLTWLHLGFLATVSLLPFSTRLLGEFIDYRFAMLVYWLNILALGLLILACWSYARHARLLREDAMSPEVDKAVRRRVIVAQALYAVGATLCLINTYLSIAFIVLVQLNYALAPFDRRVSRP